jgi:Domain of Unknown Function with PDB structure (DUF3857)/Transglutaminase-like superfamily
VPSRAPGIKPSRRERNVHRFLFVTTLLASLAAPQSGTSGAPATNQFPAPSAKVAPIRANLPSKFELLRTRYRFENDGTGRKEIITRIRILNKMGVLQRTGLTFDYKPFSESLEIRYVRVVKKDGRVANIAEGEVVQRPNIPAKAGIAEYDYDEKRLTVPGLSPGDALEYDVVTVVRHPLAKGQFWAQYDFQPSGVSEEQLEIDVPNGRVVKVRVNPGIKGSQTEGGQRDIYQWKRSNPTRDDHRITSDPWHRTPDVQLSSFASWEEVGRWYAGLEKSHRTPTPEVRTKAGELTKGLHSDLEKVEALYDFAAKKIKYISLESLGIGGYEPHSADETIRNKYGDCKDKAALLAALLEAEGMHASSVLISPNRRLDPGLPSPWDFNHVITMVAIGKDEIWMDPSAAVLPFRMLVYQTRRKQALVIPPDGTAHLEETPADAPVPNTWLEEIDGKINENGTLDARVNITARGDAELSLRQAFVGPIESVWPITVRGAVKGINRRADKVSDIKISDPTATNEPFKLSFQISKPFFLNPAKGTTDFKLPLSDFRLPPSGEEGVTDATGWHRLQSKAVLLGPTGECAYRIRLQLPKEFEAEIPPSFTLKRNFAEYESAYNLEGNSVTAERKLLIREEEIPSRADKEYSVFQRRVIADLAEGIKVRVANKRAPERR